RLKIEDVSGTIVFDIDIVSGGAGFIPFTPPKKNAAANTALIITLYAGGSGIQGKVNGLGAWTEASTGVYRTRRLRPMAKPHAAEHVTERRLRLDDHRPR